MLSISECPADSLLHIAAPSHRGLETLHLDSLQFIPPGSPYATFPALASSLLLLPKLRSLKLALNCPQLPEKADDVVFHLPSLTSLDLLSPARSLGSLPTFHAPKLESFNSANGLDCASLATLALSFPRLVSLETGSYFECAIDATATALESTLSSQPNPWPNRRVFTTVERLPIELCAAACQWTQLRVFQAHLPSSINSLRIVALLRSLLELTSLTLSWYQAPAPLEAFTLAPTVEPVSLPKLEWIDTAFACDEMFATLRFPNLVRFAPARCAS